jgi:serine/threonine-protein kinase
VALAEAAIQAAARLRPDAGETHLARAQNLYWGYRNYDGALAEVELARPTLPNDFRIYRLMGPIQRRQGHWEESTRNLERALELNPRDFETVETGITLNNMFLRRYVDYADKKSVLARTFAVFQDDSVRRLFQAEMELWVKADTRPLHKTLDSIRATNPEATFAESWFWCAMHERDATAARSALDAYGENVSTFTFGHELIFSRSLLEGLIARMTKDEGKARSAFVAARAEQEKVVQAQPNDSKSVCTLGLIDAFLGRKEEALREGRRAVELLPVEKDAVQGVCWVEYLAMIAALVGDKDLAFEQLESIIRLPSPISYGNLKLLPFWDPLRGDPRFEKILEEAKQPVQQK